MYSSTIKDTLFQNMKLKNMYDVTQKLVTITIKKILKIYFFSKNTFNVVLL